MRMIMLVKYFIIVIIGLFGVGIIIIINVIKYIFRSLDIDVVFIEGDSFYCYICLEMDKKVCEV